MNETQLAVAKRIATEIMGWQWEHHASTGYTNDQTCRVTDANYRFSSDELFCDLYVGRVVPSDEPAYGKYSFRWHKWNPFEDDWHEVFARLTDLGREVTVVGAKDFFSCSISGWYALENGSNLYTERGTSKLPGHAVCEACIKFLDGFSAINKETDKCL